MEKDSERKAKGLSFAADCLLSFSVRLCLGDDFSRCKFADEKFELQT
jgi:hypothetical protein